jgi:hypothetical protein
MTDTLAAFERPSTRPTVAAFNPPRDTSRADGNFDGAATIDLTDLNAVLNNLGVSTTGSGGSAQIVVAAPEPASVGVVGIAGLLLMRRRHRAPALAGIVRPC